MQKQEFQKQETALKQQYQQQETLKAELLKQETRLKETRDQEKDRDSAKLQQQKQFNEAQEKARKDLEARQGHSIIAPKLELTPKPDWDTRVQAAEEARRQLQEKQAADIAQKTRENFEKRHDQLGTDTHARDEARKLMEERLRAEQERRAAEDRARAERMQQVLREQRVR